MESFKLISSTKYVLEQFNLLYNAKITQDKYVTRTKKYADFLSKPLSIEMFVPCDEAGNVLEEKKPFQDNYFEFQEAKKRCLFEDFEMDNSFVTHKSHNSFFYPISCLHEQTIEDLIKYNLELTKTAQKQIGL